jgi:phage-related protein
VTHPTLTLPVGVEPSVGTSSETTARVREASFGDGYSQITADGLNSVSAQVTLVLEGIPVADAEAVQSVLAGWRGATTFVFMLPGSSLARRWTCRKWSSSPPEYGLTTLTLTLTESFAP